MTKKRLEMFRAAKRRMLERKQEEVMAKRLATRQEHRLDVYELIRRNL